MTDIYDYVPASTLEEGVVEQIVFENDFIEATVTHTNGGVMVKGYSHISGDNVFYIIDNDAEVGLWTV